MSERGIDNLQYSPAFFPPALTAHRTAEPGKLSAAQAHLRLAIEKTGAALENKWIAIGLVRTAIEKRAIALEKKCVANGFGSIANDF
jgi:hypothetical protein